MDSCAATSIASNDKNEEKKEREKMVLTVVATAMVEETGEIEADLTTK